MAPLGESQQPKFPFWRLLREFQHKVLSRISLDRLLNKIDNNSTGISKYAKIEVVKGLFEQQKTLCSLKAVLAFVAYMVFSPCLFIVAKRLDGSGHHLVRR